MVKENCAPGVTQFKVLAPTDGQITIGDVLKKKFAIEVNNKRYDVYPQLETMIQRDQVSEQTRHLIYQALEGGSIPIARRVILKQYFERVLESLYSKNAT